VKRWRADETGSRQGGAIKTVNLKSDRAPVAEVRQRLEREISAARQQQHSLLKIIHGYGSKGEGGDIRIAVQRRLQELAEAGQIRACIFGENWSEGDESTWSLLKKTRAEKRSGSGTGKQRHDDRGAVSGRQPRPLLGCGRLRRRRRDQRRNCWRGLDHHLRRHHRGLNRQHGYNGNQHVLLPVGDGDPALPESWDQ
jgi:hypothetical protein